MQEAVDRLPIDENAPIGVLKKIAEWHRQRGAVGRARKDKREEERHFAVAKKISLLITRREA